NPPIFSLDPKPRHAFGLAVLFFCPLTRASPRRCQKNKTRPDVIGAGFLLPDLDSNQDKQNQNLRYYRYTIGQSRFCY
ncbi:hypothetical protein, partial [Niastella koreensis]